MQYNDELKALLFNGILISEGVYNFLHNFDSYISLDGHEKLPDSREAERSIRKLNDDLVGFINNSVVQSIIPVSVLPDLINQLATAIDRLPLTSGLFLLTQASVVFGNLGSPTLYFTFQEQNSKKDFTLELYTDMTLSGISAFRFNIGKQNKSVRLSIYPSEDRVRKSAHTWKDHTYDAIYYAIKGGTVVPVAGIPLLSNYSSKVRQTTNRNTASIDWLEKRLVTDINTLVFDLKLTKKEQSRIMSGLTDQVLSVLPWKTRNVCVSRLRAVSIVATEAYDVVVYDNGGVEIVFAHPEGRHEIKVTIPFIQLEEYESSYIKWAIRLYSNHPFMPIGTDTGGAWQKKQLRELLENVLVRD